MSSAIDNIASAYKYAMANRPKVNGFPFLAEVLRQAGVIRYVYNLPSCQCIFYTQAGNVVSQMETLVTGMGVVPRFDKEAFIKVLRTSQAGDSTFPEFLKGTWESGVISYQADLIARKVSYYGADGESYIEDYPLVEVKR